MKKILTIALLAGACAAKAQITLEHTYSPTTGGATAILFSSNGTKIIANDTGTGQIKLYNTDYTLWKTITPPAITGFKFGSASIISDNLFNADNLIEFAGSYYNQTTGQSKTIIATEAGSILLDLGSTSCTVQYLDGAYKLFVYSVNTTSGIHYATDIYSLPGELPCGHCASMGVPKTAHTGAYISAPIPNPSNGTAIIQYVLPADVKAASLTVYNADGRATQTYPVNAYDKQLTIDNSTLATGDYFCIISAENMAPVSNKMTVVH